MSHAFNVDHEPYKVLEQQAVLYNTRHREALAQLLARIAAIDAHKHYLAAGFGSMRAWCEGVLGLTTDVAERRIRAARLARQYPAIFAMIADGRLDVSHLGLLAPHLTSENAERVLASAARKSRFELEILIAQLSPKPDVPERSLPLSPATPAPEFVQQDETKPALVRVEQLVAPDPRPRVAPLSPQRYGWQLTATQEMQDDLEYLKDLCAHAVPSRDMREILARALKLAIRHEEQRKFGRTACSRKNRGTRNARHIPAAIRREVWQRDGGRCTFGGDSGHRCDERSRLEFDHATPVARGGQTTVANLRLRCRAHNGFEAERVFGRRFMDARRAKPPADSLEDREMTEDVISCLRSLGCRADEARRIASLPDVLGSATLEGRVRRAVMRLAPPSVVRK